jgi:hypothetical protein
MSAHAAVNPLTARDNSRPDLSRHGGRYSLSLGKGLAILLCFTAGRPVLGLADISAEIGLNRSTILH